MTRLTIVKSRLRDSLFIKLSFIESASFLEMPGWSSVHVAIKADMNKLKVGQVIGKALENFNPGPTGKIRLLVSIKWPAQSK